MKKKDSSFSRKFIITVGIIYSLLIIFFALSFNIIITNNSNLLRDTVISNNSSLLIERSRLAIESIENGKKGAMNDIRDSLKKYCTGERGFFKILIFSKTQDDNYFKLIESVEVGGNIDIDIAGGSTVSEEKDKNYLKSGLIKETAEPRLYTKNGVYWQNVYHPYKINNTSYVIQFMMSASRTFGVINSYYESMKKLRWISIAACVILVLSVGALTVIFVQNYSLLIRNLSAYMDKAAKGDLNFNIKTTDDRELNELALSFNSLIEELKEKSSQDPHGSLFKLGVEKLKDNSLDDSIALFRTITLLNPEHFASFFNLGVAFAKKKNYEFSLKMFRKSMAINPSYELTAKYIEKINRIIGPVAAGKT